MSNLSRRTFRRICLIKPSSPGDIIHALPVLRGLRRRYPQAHISWLVASPFVNLLEAEPAIDEIIPFDRRRFGRIGRSFAVTRDFVAFLRRLRRNNFDLIIDLQGLFRSGFFALASGAEVRIGFKDARELAWIFYNHRMGRQECKQHAADINYAVADVLGFDHQPLDFRIVYTDEDQRQAAALLAEVDIATDQPYTILVPATRWETKCWPAERYGQLAAMLKQRIGLTSILVGGPSDTQAGQKSADVSDGCAQNLCGKTTLRQLVALIDHAAVVVTADSTPMHIAAAHHRPMVALFGPTDPLRTGPYGRLDDVLRLDLSCSPCFFRKLNQCPHRHACMQDMTVETVAAAVSQRLSRAESNF